MLLLFDISTSQDMVDYQLLAKRTSGGFIKATGGTTVKDGRFKTHWEQTRKAGIPRGAYHFWVPGKPKTQAKFFFETVESTGDFGELPPVLDVEKKGKASEIRDCAREISRLFGRQPIIYTRQSIFDFLSGDTTWANNYLLWVANYISTKDDKLIIWSKNLIEKFAVPAMPEKPVTPRDWEEWTLWQFSQRGKGPEWGTHRINSKQIDLTMFDGSLKALLALGGTAIDQVDLGVGEISEVQPIQVSASVLEKIKESGITPTIQININLADFNMKAFKQLKGKLEEAGVTPEVHINIQVGSGGADHRGSDSIQDLDSGETEEPGPEPKPKNSITVEVKAKTGQKTAVQSIVDRKENGVPVMGPHKPRIALRNGTRLRVSKTHKESGKDKGDGVIYGGRQQYYKITDETENDKAAGLFVKKQDVRPV